MNVAKQRKKPADKSGTDWPKKLKDLRERLGERVGKERLTQAEAAALIKVTRRAWILWESGEKIPSPPFAKLLSLLETHPESFS